MRLRYLSGKSVVPLPSLGGSYFRHRPIMPVRITGPRHETVRDCLVDTGADDTVFPTSLATYLGIDLRTAIPGVIALAGRSTFACSYVPVRLWITDAINETYEWTAVVGFVPVPLRNALLGHAGFLQFFDAEFRGHDREVLLTPNPSFPGHRI